jgi:hypothetical protein
MLAEFILTPDIFSANEDILRGRLSDLREVLLPRGSVPKFVICQLGSDKWQTAVGGKIAAIRNPELRSNAKALFERLVAEVSVVRPLSKSETPKSESDWIYVGERSSRQIGLDGIVASESSSKTELVLSIEKFVSDEYCERFKNPRFVARSEEAQIESLRTLCFHSEWMILRLPQIRGGTDDEIVTLKQVLKLASARLPEQTKCSVEIHVCRQVKIPDDRLKNSITDELSGFLNNLAEVDVKLFPERAFTDRQVFAGEWAPMPNDQRLRRVRWLVTMTHVAIGKRRESSSEPCTWSLFDRKSAHARYQELQKQLEEVDLPPKDDTRPRGV